VPSSAIDRIFDAAIVGCNDDVVCPGMIGVCEYAAHERFPCEVQQRFPRKPA
jgi:hypothetical protein